MLIKVILKKVAHGYYNKDKVMDNTFPIALNSHFSDNPKISVISLIKFKQEKPIIYLNIKINFKQMSTKFIMI